MKQIDTTGLYGLSVVQLGDMTQLSMLDIERLQYRARWDAQEGDSRKTTAAMWFNSMEEVTAYQETARNDLKAAFAHDNAITASAE